MSEVNGEFVPEDFEGGIDPDTGLPKDTRTEEQKKTDLLATWYASLQPAEDAKKIVAVEQMLRKQVMELFFPSPTEGVNNLDLGNGYGLKFTYKIDRKVDEDALPAIKEKLREMNINPDVLVEYKPTLKTTEYKTMYTLNPEAGKLFDTALTIKPGSHTLEIKTPKEKPNAA